MSADVIDSTTADDTVNDVAGNEKSDEVTVDNGNKDEVVLGSEVVEKKDEVVLGDAVKDEDIKDAEGNPYAPEKYEDFTLPDGFEAQEGEIDTFMEHAKELDLTQEQAQKLLDKQLALKDEQMKLYEQDKIQQKEKWINELKQDEEFGGRNMSETIERANRTLRKFADNDVIEILKETGYANNPSIVKMFARIDKQLGEDSLVGGESAKAQELSPLDKLYNHPTSKS